MVLHISSFERMKAIFTSNLLCCCFVTVRGIKFYCCGKVSLQIGGLEQICYVVAEEGIRMWKVFLDANIYILIERGEYNENSRRCYFENNTNYTVLQYWPMRLQIRQGKVLYCVHRMVCTENDNIIPSRCT